MTGCEGPSMRSTRLRLLLLVLIALSSLGLFAVPEANAACTAANTGVTICSPADGASLTSPVTLSAGAKSSSSSDPISSMKVYVDGVGRDAVRGAQLTASLILNTGAHQITVKAWTASGAVLARTINITVTTGCSAASNTVNICAPANGATVSSPMRLIAAVNMAAGLSGAKVYVDGTSRLTTTSSRIDTSLSLSSGPRRITVKGWGKDGTVASRTISVDVTSSGTAAGLKTEVVADGLYVPWEMVFAPDGRMFFTEQRGRLRVIANGSLVSTPLLDLRSRTRGGEQGVLGLEIDPNFSSNRYLYMFWCFITGSTTTGCKIDRIVVESNTSARFDKTLLQFAGSNQHHNAGRLKLGRDGFLYASIGDFGVRDNAQRLSTLGGKIIRMRLDGSPAPGNPFGTAPYVYAMGFRDPQGLAFDNNGVLYATDHGNVFNDEVDLVTMGGNYGWPNCEGSCTNSQYIAPLRVFTNYTIAPSGATFYYSSVISQWTGSLLFASLGQADDPQARHLHRLRFGSDGKQIVAEEVLFKDQFGRIRNVVQGPDGFVYFSTGNGAYADKIIRVRPGP